MCFVAIKTGQKSKCIFERFAYSYSVLFSANFRLLFSSVLRAIRKSYLYAIRVAVLSYRSWRNLQYNAVYSLQCTVTNRWFTRNIRFVNDRQNRRKSCPQPGGGGVRRVRLRSIPPQPEPRPTMVAIIRTTMFHLGIYFSV